MMFLMTRTNPARPPYVNDRPLNADELIREAYAVVAEPERLFDLQLRLARAQQRFGDETAVIGEHLDQIGDLFDALHLGPDADFSNYSLAPHADVDGVPARAPLLSLDETLHVLDAGDDAWPGGAVPQPREIAPDWLFGPTREARQRVRKFIRQSGENAVCFTRLFAGPDDPRGFMVMGQLHEHEGQRSVAFTRVRLEWEDDAGARFAEVMGLSEAETALTAAIVSGASVAEFAEERGRSVGTARNQMKAVLRKLGIGSQSELVSLYAGFVSSLSLQASSQTREDRPAFGHVADLPDGTQLNFARYGRAGGRPVILLHGAIEGPFMPPNVQQAAYAADLEIFVPWMPFYSDTDRMRDPKACVENFTARLEGFCAALKIEHCGLMACSVSCAYGFAAAARLPHLFVGMVAFALVMPLSQIDEIEGVHPLWRAPLLLGRSAPGAVELMVRAVVKLAMRGEAHLYFGRLFKDSPRDLATLHRPDVASTVRQAFQNRPDKAQRAMAHAVLIQALDWNEWIEKCETPVRVVIAQEDVVHKPELQVEFCQRHGFDAVGPLPGLGGFALFQDPHLIFAEMRSLFDS